MVLGRPLPLRIGDRALLRDPGSRRIWGVTVLDPAPPPLTRRGDAARRARVLAGFAGQPELAEELRRRGIVELSLLRQVGVESLDASAIATLAIVRKGWLLPRRLLPEFRGRLTDAVVEHDATNPLDLGLPIPVAARSLGLPVAEVTFRPRAQAAGRGTADGSAQAKTALNVSLGRIASRSFCVSGR